MREIKSRTSLLINLSSSLVIGTITSFTSHDAMAGSRHCQRYSDNSTVCVDEKGYKLYCRTERGDGYDGKKDVCIGKGNYRKECKGLSTWGSTCIDSKGIKSICKGDGSPVGYCQKSDGTRSRCISYSNGVTICNDIDKKGSPI
jgi:hypothetical protein